MPFSSMRSLKDYLDRLSLLEAGAIRRLLLKYADEEILSGLDLETIRRLASILLWVDENFGIYGRAFLDVEVSEECDEIQFFKVVLEDCGWDEWGFIVKVVKDEMRRCGLEDMTSKVAIVCLRGLIDLTS